MSIWSSFCHQFCDFKTLRSHHRLSTQHQNKNSVSKGFGKCLPLSRSQIFNHQYKFQKLWAFEFFSVIIFVISRLYGHTTGLVLNTKIKTKSQKVQGNVLFYLGSKYWNTKIHFKSYVHLKFFLPSILWFQDLTVTSQALNTKMKTKSHKVLGMSSII